MEITPEQTAIEQIEAIKEAIGTRSDFPLPVGPFEKIVRRILYPPKPRGQIDPDNLPEVGTVFECKNKGQRKVVFINRWGVFTLHTTEGQTDLRPYWRSNDEWNRTVVPLITAVIPPAKPPKPQIRLSCLPNGNVFMGPSDDGVQLTVIGCNRRTATIRLRKVLKTAGIDVEGAF